jgi:hypothetical protein
MKWCYGVQGRRWTRRATEGLAKFWAAYFSDRMRAAQIVLDRAARYPQRAAALRARG